MNFPFKAQRNLTVIQDHVSHNAPYVWADALEANIQAALDEPPFMDRERQALESHLAELRAEAEQKIAAIEHHKSEIALLEAELAERTRSIEAHEAAASKLT